MFLVVAGFSLRKSTRAKARGYQLIERSEIMKMVMVVYNEAIDMEVMEVLANCALKNYTKVTGVYGSGEVSGVHLGNDVWPGRNNILYVACQQNEAQNLISRVKELRKELGKEGIKAFVLPIEEIT